MRSKPVPPGGDDLQFWRFAGENPRCVGDNIGTEDTGRKGRGTELLLLV